MFFSPRVGWILLFTVSLSVTMQVSVSADPIPTSVVVLHPGRDEATIRLAAELSALGYAPILLQHSTEALWIDQVRTIMTTYRAEALINATSIHDRVDIWVVDSKSDSMQLWVDTVDAVKDSDASTILKSVETLRAGLMRIEGIDFQGAPVDFKHVTTVNAGQGGAGSDRAKAFSASPGRLSLAIGPAGTYGFGDLPAAWQIAVSGGVRIASRLSLMVVGFAPTAPMSFKNQYGSAQVWMGSLTIGLRADLRPPDKRWVPWAEFGVGPNFSRMKGQGNAPYSDGDDRAVVFEMLFRSGIRVWMNRRFSLEGSLHVGGCLPKPVVRVGEVRADYSVPLFGGTIQLAFDLF
jgi:hypothetical protein